MDFRAAFIDIGAGPIACVKLSGGEAGILISRKSAAPSVGEIKEGHVEHEHWVVTAASPSSKHLTPAAPRSALIQFSFHLIFCLPDKP
jgi:hypothetical protein